MCVSGREGEVGAPGVIHLFVYLLLKCLQINVCDFFFLPPQLRLLDVFTMATSGLVSARLCFGFKLNSVAVSRSIAFVVNKV